LTANTATAGHLAAAFSIAVWGTTFIFTKVLLVRFTPAEILFYRFSVCVLALAIACPRRLRIPARQELLFAGAGLCGVTLYFLLENFALTYTLASNVAVIVAAIPFFTAILSHWFLDNERLRARFFVGFIAAITGIILINFNGSMVLKLNPLGDLLALLAAVSWSVYAILTKKISALGYNTIQATRRIFAYGLLFMLPSFLATPFAWGIDRFSDPVTLFNILFLGLGASALCFVTWNTAVKILGAVKTTIYIYMGPVITVIASALVLHETITWVAICGTALILAGLIISASNKPAPQE